MSIASLVQAAGTSTVGGFDPLFMFFVLAAVAVLVVTAIVVWPSSTNRSDEIPGEVEQRQEPAQAVRASPAESSATLASKTS